MTRPSLSWGTTVSPNYRMFGFHDPTCEELENFATAVAAASRGEVGWGSNALMVKVASDLVRIRVGVEVLEEPPTEQESADLVEEGQLAIPGGVVSLPQSTDDRLQRGVDLPTGSGTYKIRVYGYGRDRARHVWETSDGREMAEIVDALEGVERYRLLLWRISAEPSWDDDEDDD